MKKSNNLKPKRSSSIRKGFKYQDLQALRLALELYLENVDFQLYMEEDIKGNLDDVLIFIENQIQAYQVKHLTSNEGSYKMEDFIKKEDPNDKRIHIKKFVDSWKDLKKKYPEKEIQIFLLSNHSEGDDLLNIVKQGQFQENFIKNRRKDTRYFTPRTNRKLLKDQTELEEEEFKDFLKHFHFRLNDKNLEDLIEYIKENLLLIRLNIENIAIFEKLRVLFDDYATNEREPIDTEFFKEFFRPFELKTFKKLPEELSHYIINQEDPEFKRVVKVYVKPKGYKLALQKLKKNRFLIITGPPHIGKSSTLQRLAYDLNKSYEDIKIIIEIENQPEAILKNFNNSIILFDDIFGKLDFKKKNRADKLNKILNLTQNPYNNFIICTTRKEILLKAKKETEIYFYEEYEFNIEQEGSYNNDALNQILNNHLKYFLRRSIISQTEVKIAEKNRGTITKELRFPHNYPFLINNFLKLVSKKSITIFDAINRAKHIKKAVKIWFSNISNNEIKYFIFTVVLFQNIEKNKFEQIYKNIISIVKKKRAPEIYTRPVNFLMQDPSIAAYIHYKGNSIAFIHPSYLEGIIEQIKEETYFIDDINVIKPILMKINETQCISKKQFIRNILYNVSFFTPELSLHFLEKLISNPNEGEMILIAMVLIKIGEEDLNLILPILEKNMKSENMYVRINIASTLVISGVKSPEVILPFLEKKMSCKDEKIKFFVSFALIEMALIINGVILPFLEENMKSDDENISNMVESILVGIGNRNSNLILPFLEKNMRSDDKNIKVTAVMSFLGIGLDNPDVYILILEKIMSGKDEKLKDMIALSLIRIGIGASDIIIPFLEKIMNSTNENVRVFAKEIYENIQNTLRLDSLNQKKNPNQIRNDIQRKENNKK